MTESKKRVFKPKLETKLAREDHRRVDDLARAEGKTKSEVLREAVLWYLDNKEQIKNEPHDKAIALSIEAMTNRICAMLARQGRQVATMFELTHDSMSGTAEGEASFAAAVTRANQKTAKRVQEEERELIAAMRKALKPGAQSE
ncbi:MAG: ribbon-helix-helix protein, CopG family [Candidatus Micrarchaeaceae archaeon]